MPSAESFREIQDLIFKYAELIDAGDLDGVAELFAGGVIYGVENGPPETVFAGLEEVRAMYDSVILYDDGTPKTKHHITNVRLNIDDDNIRADGTAYFLVTQATNVLPLQVIAAGRYRDTFHYRNGRWGFMSRTMFFDQAGDTSQHLR